MIASKYTMDNESTITTLACELAAACAAYKPTPGLEPCFERDEILRKTREITLAVSSPMHFMWTQMTNIHALGSLRTLLHFGVFNLIPSTGTIGLDQLAKQSGLEAALLQRLLRVMVATQFINSDGSGVYSHTRNSRAFADSPHIMRMLQLLYDDFSIGRLQQYLVERKSSAEPDDQAYNPYTWSHGQDGRTVWDIMADTGKLETFQNTLGAMEKNFPPTGFFDYSILATDEDRDILVDVGGGVGKALADIVNSSPQLKERAHKFVLQDLEQPLEVASKSGILPAGVRTMKSDMFAGQPIRGAKAYYIRRVLHDYSDARCVEILKHLASAAAPDSSILISEMILPEKVGEGELPVLCMDMSMMTIGGKQRTKEQWQELLSASGLELRKIWVGIGPDRLLEARLNGVGEEISDAEVTEWHNCDRNINGWHGDDTKMREVESTATI